MPPLKHVLIGNDTLLISCAEVLRERGHEVTAVVTADRSISSWCATNGVPHIAQDAAYASTLAEHSFDYLLSITNLERVPAAALRLPRKEAINFHDGPLPRYGGLYAPAWAILAGEPSHAVSWHLMSEAFDTGDVVIRREFVIGEEDTSLTLNAKCFEAGLGSFAELVELMDAGDLPRHPHELDHATYHGLGDRPRGLGALDPRKPGAELERLVRAMDFGGYPNPLVTPRIVGPNGSILVGGAVSFERSPSAVAGRVSVGEGGRLRLEALDGELTFSSPCTLAGEPLDGASALARLGVAEGGQLPLLADEFIAAADVFAAGAARHEVAWAKRLATLSIPELPDRKPPEGASQQRGRVALAGTHASDTAAVRFAIFVARVCGRTTVDVGYRAQTQTELAPVRAHLTDLVPLRVELKDSVNIGEAVAAVTRELGRAQSRVGILRDIGFRRPALKGLCVKTLGLPIAIIVGEATEYAFSGDLALFIGDDGSLALDYNQTLTAETATRLASLFTEFLTAPAEQPWRAFSLLTDTERQLVLEQWGKSPRRSSLGEPGIHQQIAQQAVRTPDAVAVICEGQQLTYRELDARANQLAHRLRALGAAPDSFVALCCNRSVEVVVGLLGILKSGAAYVPIDPTYPTDRIALMLEDSQAHIVVSMEVVLGELPETRATIVCLDRDRAELDALPTTAPAIPFAPQQLAYCIYTSGSTGRPKGVMVEHRNVTAFFGAMDERLGTDPGVWLAVTSLSFDISVLELCWTLARGYTVVVYADTARGSAELGLVNARKGIDFSLFYFSANEADGSQDPYRILIEGAKFGDRHGFTAVWTPERHFHAFGGLYPNPAVTGAAVAAVTSRIGIRSGSCVLPLHHPVRVAEEWAVVDNLSGGRVALSFSTGWQPNDFIFQPQNYADFKTKTVELIDVVRRLWRGESVDFEGPRGMVSVKTLPRPRQAELPVWYTTAGNPQSYELAGRLGANVLTHLLGQSVDELADKITIYRRARKAAGHAGPGQISLMLHTFVGESDEEVKALVRGPMKAYLSTSISLIQGFASAFPTFKKSKDGKAPELDFQSLSAEEMDALLDYSFERYYETSGLFGTVETCARLVDRLKGIGVDDIACLIDFGVETDRVLGQLKLLNRLRLLTSRPRRGDADYSIPALISRHGVTHLQCTPSMASMLVADDRSRDALRSLRAVCIGGEAFPPALAKELRRLVPGDIHNMYGPTETTIWSSMHTLGDNEQQIPLGIPLADNELYVLDALGQPVPPGTPGELFIGGAQVTRGYWRRPDLTTERFLAHPLRSGGGARVYRTGDLVRWGTNGRLEFLGRTDFQVKVRGYRIELGEIESAVGAHPAVREAVVIARKGATDADDARLVAYVVWHREPNGGTAELREQLRRGLPEYMVPAHFVVLRDLPRTPNQKVDRKALPEPSVSEATQPVAPTELPSGDLEVLIAQVWQEHLKLPSVGIDDNFFDLGGHSLLAVQIHSRLKRELSRDVAITDLFRFPTIRRLAEFLGGGTENAALKGGADRAAQRRELAARRIRRTATKPTATDTREG